MKRIRDTDPRSGQELPIVRGECAAGDARLAGNYAIREGVIRGAAMRLVPARGGLEAEAQRQRQPLRGANRILRV